MTARDKRWWLTLALVVILLTGLPYLLAYQQAGDAWTFSGFLIGVDDGNSYIAKMLRGSIGDWLFETPYTLEDQAGVLVFIPYLLLGKLAAGQALHEQLVGLYHLARSLSIAVAVYGTHRLLRVLISDRGLQRWATAAAIAGGGLGWMLALVRPPAAWDQVPLAFLSPETFGFLALFSLPHLALARGLMMLALAGYLAQLRGESDSWWPGLWAALAVAVNPLTGVSLGIVIAAHQLVVLGRHLLQRQMHLARRRLTAGIRLMLPAIPYLGYLAWLSNRDSFLIRWAAQNQVLSPPPLMYLLAYLPLLPALAAGVASRWRSADDSDLLPLIWLLILPFMIYAPVGVQRRLPEGSWIALVALAAWGLGRLQNAQARRRLAAINLILLLPASSLVLAGGAATALMPAEPAFEPANYVAAYEYMHANGPANAAVIGAPRSENAAPAYAAVRTPIGHGPESVDGQAQTEAVALVYQQPQSTAAAEWIAKHAPLWLVWGPRERAWSAQTTDPGSGWRRVGEWGQVRLYRRVVAP